MESRPLATCTVLWLACGIGSRAVAQCPEWSDEFLLPGTDNFVYDTAAYDDGRGLALFVAGGFRWAGKTPAQRLARWDGTSWSAVDTGFTPTMGKPVRALQVHDDGSGPELFVGGEFTTAGGAAGEHVMKWDGTSWTPLGPGILSSSGGVYCLAVFDDGTGPALYAGGKFHTAGGSAAANVARWTGSVWEPLASGTSGAVYALQVFDEGTGRALYVAGAFQTAGGVPAHQVARWDGSSWSTVGGGLVDPLGGLHGARSLAVHDDGSGPALYAGGYFTTAGGAAADKIARWDGSSWSAVGAGMQPTNIAVVHSLRVFDDGSGPALVAGGNFDQAGAKPVRGIARWDGSDWHALGGGLAAGLGGGLVFTLEVFDEGSGPALFAGGVITSAGGAVANNIASWDGGDWRSLGAGQGADLSVLALLSTVQGPEGGEQLYAGGSFQSIGEAGSRAVARWDGARWHSLGTGMAHQFSPTWVEALAVFDDGAGSALYAGGTFRFAGGVPADHIARWDGAAWAPVGSGTDGNVNALTVFDDGSGPALYAGGFFREAGGVDVKRIAMWDGTQWHDVGGGVTVAGVNPEVDALAVFDDGNGPALYAAGAFKKAGSVAAHRIARWDGTAWSSVGGIGLDSRAFALTVHDGGAGPALYVGGKFTGVSGLAVERIARWDGSAWSQVGAIDDSLVLALTSWNDGSGGAQLLIAGGSFQTAGGLPGTSRVAAWDGSSWSPLDQGADYDVEALAVSRDGPLEWPALFVGGAFDQTSGTLSHHVGRWSNPCACEGSSYCTAGTTASGCNARISSSGKASVSAVAGFQVTVSDLEGKKDGVIYYGTNGAKAGSWGNGTSLQCVVPPVVRTGVQQGVGTLGACDGTFQLDFNAWMAARPGKAPQAGQTVRMQAWFRDPQNTSNQSTSLSEALVFAVCP